MRRRKWNGYGHQFWVEGKLIWRVILLSQLKKEKEFYERRELRTLDVKGLKEGERK